MVSSLLRRRSSVRGEFAAVFSALFAGVLLSFAGASAAEPPTAERWSNQFAPLLKRLCFECHADERPDGPVDLSKLGDPHRRPGDRDLWLRLLDAVESDVMPPADRPQLTPVERRALIEWLEGALFQIDCSKPPDPGRVTIRRLNRFEYDRTVRDLLGVDFRPSDDFPTDDVGYGFDNIGDVLSVSPLLVEKYLSAAERIAADAVRRAESQQARRVRLERRDLQTEGAVRLSPFGVYVLTSRGSVSGRFEAARAGEYLVRVRAAAQQAGDELAKVELSIDGRPAKTLDVEATPDKARDYAVPVRLDAGARRISAAFINDYYNPDAPDRTRRDRNLFITFLEVEGPTGAESESPPPGAHAAGLALVRPVGRSTAEAARTTLGPFMRRAFRRPVTDDETARYARLVEQAVARGDSYERGVEAAVAGVLVSPHFLFRLERDAPGSTDPIVAPGVRSLDDHELAVRLSYFLWSTMPDAALQTAADRGELRTDEQLKAQVRRMLADPKASALATNFGGQWLNLRTLDEIVPDPKQFPGIDAALKADFRRETELLFAAIVRENRPISDFLDADYTYLNERLARHYDLTERYASSAATEGESFRRVSLAGARRAGVLTHASVLLITSNPTRTSPVKRGKWILENLLGAPPPEPPADVPQLEATRRRRPDATLREQLEIHRQDAQCAVCHRQMDALGFGFENFDVVGRWRDADGDKPIDASGELPGGKRFAGPQELIGLLRERQTDFRRTLARQLLTYALGRGLERTDRCTVDRVVDSLAAGDGRWNALVESIVLSEPFRRRRIVEENQP